MRHPVTTSATAEYGRWCFIEQKLDPVTPSRTVDEVSRRRVGSGVHEEEKQIIISLANGIQSPLGNREVCIVGLLTGGPPRSPPELVLRVAACRRIWLPMPYFKAEERVAPEPFAQAGQHARQGWSMRRASGACSSAVSRCVHHRHLLLLRRDRHSLRWLFNMVMLQAC